MPAVLGLWAGYGGVTRQGRAGAGQLHLPGGEKNTTGSIHCHFRALRRPAGVKRRRRVNASLRLCVTSGRRRREHHAQVSAGDRAAALGAARAGSSGGAWCFSRVPVFPASPGL